MNEWFKFRRTRSTLICAAFIIVTICILSMSDKEFKRTVEDVTELEEKITAEIDNIGKLLEELDFLKEKLQILHKKIEEVKSDFETGLRMLTDAEVDEAIKEELIKDMTDSLGVFKGMNLAYITKFLSYFFLC